MDYIFAFFATLKVAACSALLEPPLLPDYGTHKVTLKP